MPADVSSPARAADPLESPVPAADTLAAPAAPIGSPVAGSADAALLPRLLPGTGRPMDLMAHLQAHGGTPYRGGPGILIDSVEASGLTGRGGAAFPTHRKLVAVAGQNRISVVVGNGAEGEPASNKDKALLWASPHLVLDGLQLAAEAVGARRAHLYIHRDSRLLRRLQSALAARSDHGLDRIEVGVVTAPPRFLAGEKSALVGRVQGGAALPRFAPPRLSERGVNGAPTLVQNVETLAQVALIARYGASWFRIVGTEREPGSMLTTLWRADGSSTVAESAIGAPITDLLGLHDQRGQAVLVGGYHGAWLSVEQAGQLTLSNVDLRPFGASVGAGVLATLPADRCGLVESARVVRYLALESAGQCGPCLNGLPRIAATLSRLAECRSAPGGRDDLERWSRLVERRGACHHPDGTVRFLRSALTVFADELGSHEARRCTAETNEPFLPIPETSPGHKNDWS